MADAQLKISASVKADEAAASIQELEASVNKLAASMGNITFDDKQLNKLSKQVIEIMTTAAEEFKRQWPDTGKEIDKVIKKLEDLSRIRITENLGEFQAELHNISKNLLTKRNFESKFNGLVQTEGYMPDLTSLRNMRNQIAEIIRQATQGRDVNFLPDVEAEVQKMLNRVNGLASNFSFKELVRALSLEGLQNQLIRQKAEYEGLLSDFQNNVNKFYEELAKNEPNAKVLTSLGAKIKEMAADVQPAISKLGFLERAINSLTKAEDAAVNKKMNAGIGQALSNYSKEANSFVADLKQEIATYLDGTKRLVDNINNKLKGKKATPIDQSEITGMQDKLQSKINLVNEEIRKQNGLLTEAQERIRQYQNSGDRVDQFFGSKATIDAEKAQEAIKLYTDEVRKLEEQLEHIKGLGSKNIELTNNQKEAEGLRQVISSLDDLQIKYEYWLKETRDKIKIEIQTDVDKAQKQLADFKQNLSGFKTAIKTGSLVKITAGDNEDIQKTTEDLKGLLTGVKKLTELDLSTASLETFIQSFRQLIGEYKAQWDKAISTKEEARTKISELEIEYQRKNRELQEIEIIPQNKEAIENKRLELHAIEQEIDKTREVLALEGQKIPILKTTVAELERATTEIEKYYNTQRKKIEEQTQARLREVEAQQARIKDGGAYAEWGKGLIERINAVRDGLKDITDKIKNIASPTIKGDKPIVQGLTNQDLQTQLEHIKELRTTFVGYQNEMTSIQSEQQTKRSQMTLQAQQNTEKTYQADVKKAKETNDAVLAAQKTLQDAQVAIVTEMARRKREAEKKSQEDQLKDYREFSAALEQELNKIRDNAQKSSAEIKGKLLQVKDILKNNETGRIGEISTWEKEWSSALQSVKTQLEEWKKRRDEALKTQGTPTTDDAFKKAEKEYETARTAIAKLLEVKNKYDNAIKRGTEAQSKLESVMSEAKEEERLKKAKQEAEELRKKLEETLAIANTEQKLAIRDEIEKAKDEVTAFSKQVEYILSSIETANNSGLRLLPNFSGQEMRDMFNGQTVEEIARFIDTIKNSTLIGDFFEKQTASWNMMTQYFAEQLQERENLLTGYKTREREIISELANAERELTKKQEIVKQNQTDQNALIELNAVQKRVEELKNEQIRIQGLITATQAYKKEIEAVTHAINRQMVRQNREDTNAVQKSWVFQLQEYVKELKEAEKQKKELEKETGRIEKQSFADGLTLGLLKAREQLSNLTAEVQEFYGTTTGKIKKQLSSMDIVDLGGLQTQFTEIYNVIQQQLNKIQSAVAEYQSKMRSGEAAKLPQSERDMFDARYKTIQKISDEYEKAEKKTSEIVNAIQEARVAQEKKLQDEKKKATERVEEEKTEIEKLEHAKRAASFLSYLEEYKQNTQIVIDDLKKYWADFAKKIGFKNVEGTGFLLDEKTILNEVENLRTQKGKIYTHIEDLRNVLRKYRQDLTNIPEGDILARQQTQHAIDDVKTRLIALIQQYRALRNAEKKVANAQANRKFVEDTNERKQQEEAIRKQTEALKSFQNQIRTVIGELGRFNEMFRSGFITDLVPTVWSVIQEMKSAFSGGNMFKSFLKDSFEFGGQFEAQMTRVKVISNSTDEQMRLLINTARDMGERLPLTAKQVAEGMEILAQRGNKTAEILSLINNVSNLSISQNVDMAKSAELLGSTIVNFNKDISEAASIIDMFNNASNNSALNINKLIEGMRYVAPAAGSLGYELEDMVGILQVMANAGLTGEMMGTGLAHIITKIGGEAELLGVKTRYLDGTARSLVDVFTELHERGTTVSDLYNIFGQRTVKAAAALTEGATSLKDLIERERQLGSTQRAVDEQMKTWPNTVVKFQSATQELHIEVFEQLKEEAKGVTNNFTDLVRAFTDFVKKNKLAGEMLQSFLDGLTTGIPSVSTFKEFLENIDISSLKEAVKGVGEYFGGLIDKLLNLRSTLVWIGEFIAKHLSTLERVTYWIKVITTGLQYLIPVIAGLGGMAALLTAIAAGASKATAALTGLAKIIATLKIAMMGIAGGGALILGLGVIASLIYNWVAETGKELRQRINGELENTKKELEKFKEYVQQEMETGFVVKVKVKGVEQDNKNEVEKKAKEEHETIQRELDRAFAETHAVELFPDLAEDIEKKKKDIINQIKDLRSQVKDEVLVLYREAKRLGQKEVFLPNAGGDMRPHSIESLEQLIPQLKAIVDLMNELESLNNLLTDSFVDTQAQFRKAINDGLETLRGRGEALKSIEGITTETQAIDAIDKLRDIMKQGGDEARTFSERIFDAFHSEEKFRALNPIEKALAEFIYNAGKAGKTAKETFPVIMAHWRDTIRAGKEADLTNPFKNLEAMTKNIRVHLNDATNSYQNAIDAISAFNFKDNIFTGLEQSAEGIKAAQASLEKFAKEAAKSYGISEDAAKIAILEELQKVIEETTDVQKKFNLEIIKSGQPGMVDKLFNGLTKVAREFKRVEAQVKSVQDEAKYIGVSLMPSIQKLQEMLSKTKMIDTATGTLNNTWKQLKDLLDSTVSAEIDNIGGVIRDIMTNLPWYNTDNFLPSLQPLIDNMKVIDPATGKINQGFMKTLQLLKEINQQKLSAIQQQLQDVSDAYFNGYMSFEQYTDAYYSQFDEVVKQVLISMPPPETFKSWADYLAIAAVKVQKAFAQVGMDGLFLSDYRSGGAKQAIAQIATDLEKTGQLAKKTGNAVNDMQKDLINGLKQMLLPSDSMNAITELARDMSTKFNNIFAPVKMGDYVYNSETVKAFDDFKKKYDAIANDPAFKDKFGGIADEFIGKIQGIIKIMNSRQPLDKAGQEYLRQFETVIARIKDYKIKVEKFDGNKPLIDVSTITTSLVEIKNALGNTVFKEEVVHRVYEAANLFYEGAKKVSEIKIEVPQQTDTTRLIENITSAIQGLTITMPEQKTDGSGLIEFGRELSESARSLNEASKRLSEQKPQTIRAEVDMTGIEKALNEMVQENAKKKQETNAQQNTTQTVKIEGLETLTSNIATLNQSVTSLYSVLSKTENTSAQPAVNNVEVSGLKPEELASALQPVITTLNQVIMAVNSTNNGLMPEAVKALTEQVAALAVSVEKNKPVNATINIETVNAKDERQARTTLQKAHELAWNVNVV